MSLALRNFLFTVVVPGTGGVLLPLACVRVFAVAGRGTPGPWDPPRRLVAIGAALLIVLGEAWLFLSLSLLEYAAAAAIFFHLLVVGYEEPRLRRTFGERYEVYRRAVSRWIPRPPRAEPT